MGFLVYLTKKTIKGSIDLFDLIVLSSVALAPAFFVFFPVTAQEISNTLGVYFPMALLFGFLFFVIFFYLTYTSSRLHKIQKQQVKLIQEISILLHHLEKKDSKDVTKK